MEIRWDTARLEEIAVDLGDKGTSLMALRGNMIETCARVGGTAVDSTAMVIASLWAQSTAEDLLDRTRRLREAETQLLWDLGPSATRHGLQAPLRARAASAIERELDTALNQLSAVSTEASGRKAARAELRVIELVYELAVATRNRALLDRRIPRPSPSLDEFIDYLGYEMAVSPPLPHLDWQRVAMATAAIRRLLDESWLGDVGRRDLLEIHEILAGLPGIELDGVIRGLSDDELFRWFHEFDGVRGGNLSEDEEATLFDTLAAAASAATLFRLAGAEGGSRFMQIASAVQRTAPPEVGIEFIEACASHAADSDEALLAALSGLAALDARRRRVAVSSLRQQELLDPLSTATAGFLERQAIERDDPAVVEFFQGLVSSIGTAVRTLGELTIVGVVDRDRFRQKWSDVGGIASLAFTDPRELFNVVIDVETLRRNPSRWTGSAVSGLLTAGLGRLARLGHLGGLAASTSGWLKRLSDTVIVGGRRLQLRARHLSPVLDRTGVALSAAEIGEAIKELAQVEDHLDELDDPTGR
jgi:hypothetical protein